MPSDLEARARALALLVETISAEHSRFAEGAATGRLTVDFHYFRGQVRAARVTAVAVAGGYGGGGGIEIPLSDRPGRWKARPISLQVDNGCKVGRKT